MRLMKCKSCVKQPENLYLTRRCVGYKGGKEREITMYQVIKRDGSIAEFDLKKICAAITKAFDAQKNSIIQVSSKCWHCM